MFNDLRNAARRQGRATDELLVLYVLERWFGRLAQSPHRDRFVLKGGLLLAALDARRPTRDGDLLAATNIEQYAIRTLVLDVAAIALDDGVFFRADRAVTAPIREDEQYAGVRVSVPATVGQAQVKLSLDINVGDPVTPGAVRQPYPNLLDAAPFWLWAYPVETVLAEKLVTAVSRGETNTRERDWADVWRLTGRHHLIGASVCDAVARTADHRAVARRPLSTVVGALVSLRGTSYRAWRQRQGRDAAAYPVAFETVVAAVIAFADPVLDGSARAATWRPELRTWRVDPIDRPLGTVVRPSPAQDGNPLPGRRHRLPSRP